MPKIKPVSDLRNYNEVLKDISDGEPVFLTKNGRGKYVILKIEDYEKSTAALSLISKLTEAEQSVAEKGWIYESEVKNKLGIE